MYERLSFFESEKPTDFLAWIVRPNLGKLSQRTVADCSGVPPRFCCPLLLLFTFLRRATPKLDTLLMPSLFSSFFVRRPNRASETGVPSGMARPVGFRSSAVLLVAALGILIGLCPKSSRAQDSTQVLAEGRTLHRPTQQVYYYRVQADSTILIRRERPPNGATIRLPITTLNFFFDRTEEHLLDPEEGSEYLGIGLENQTLVLRVSQRFDLYVLGTLVLLVLVGGPLLLWLWWRLAAERRRRKALVRSRRHLTEGREKERERLAQEIHDGPVQDLHGLHMQLKALPDLPDGLQTVSDELMRVTGELRALSADLHPPALQRFGLAAALRSHVDRLRERHPDLHLETDLPDDCGSLSDAHALAIFRIAQEALNNAVQHSNADRVRMRLRCPDDTVELTIRDDGDGFSPPTDWHALAEADHYGLLGMRERAEAIDAEVDIDSAPGDGTQVRLRSPTDASAPSPVAD